MGQRRAAEAEAEMDRMIVAFATAQAPKALEAWASRQRDRSPLDEGTKALKSARALSTMARLFPGSVRSS